MRSLRWGVAPEAMTPLFPPWANSATWLVLAMGLAGIVGLPLALWVWVRTPYVTGERQPRAQPVEFDHRHHVRDDGIGCLYCHADAERSPFAGVPPTELCMGCHGQIWNESPLLEPVRRSFFSGLPIPWRRVHALPDFVFFDHHVHVRRGVGCVSCHGQVDRMARVYQVAPLTMAWCLECHREPERFLQPPETVADPTWRAPAGEARVALGRDVRARLGVNPPTTCTACHR